MSIKLNKLKTNYFNVFSLVLISFSPLLNQYFIIIVLLLLFLLNNDAVLFSKDSRTLLFIAIIFILLIRALLDGYNSKSFADYSLLNFYYPLAFLFGYFYTQKYSIADYLKCIHKLIFPIAIMSLFGVVIYYLVPELVSRLPSYTYYHTTHKTAIVSNFLIDEYGGIIRRNAGIAWEPGAFQILLNFGLYSYFRINKKKTSFIVIFIYIIAIFFTRSTAGLLILFFQFINMIKYNKYYIYILIGIFFVFSINIINEINYQLEYKLYGSYSFDIRYNPMLEAFEYGTKNIIGLGNTGYNNLLDRGIDIGSFDSYSQIVVRYGFILLMLIIIGLLRILKYDFLLFLILFVSFFGLTIWFFPFITPFYFFKYRKNKLLVV